MEFPCLVRLDRLSHRPAPEEVNGNTRGLEDVEGIGAYASAHHGLRAPLDDELGRLDASPTPGGDGRVLRSLELHGLRVNENIGWTAPEDRAGRRVKVCAVGCDDDFHLHSS